MHDFDPSVVLPTGLNGLDLSRTSESEIFRRVLNCSANNSKSSTSVQDEETTAKRLILAKALYHTLWAMICDAKTRKRRPNGTIITPDQEAEDIRRKEREAVEKTALWAEREKHLRTGF